MADGRQLSSDDSSDDYSDDFQSDERGTPVKSAPVKRRTFPLRDRVQGQGRGHRRARGHGGRNSQTKSDTHVDVITKRLLSANRLKMNDLQNQVEDMKRQLMTLKEENKLYKRMHHKQEKALGKFENTENQLPQIIQNHSNEVRSLKEQLRRAREKFEKTDRYLRDAEDELESTKIRLKKYKSLAEKKNLEERSALEHRLNEAEMAMEEKTVKIKELERHLEYLKKNHRHEMGIERARSKDIQRQLDEMNDAKAQLEAQVREKEKQLEAKNIYSNRFGKNSSFNGTPSDSPALWRQNPKKKSESLIDLTPRRRAQAYEEKRKDEEKKKLRLPTIPSSSRKAVAPVRKPESKQKWEKDSGQKDNEVVNTVDNLQRQDSEADFWQRQEECYRRDQENRKKQEEEEEKELVKFREQREKLRRHMEEREDAERERRAADERERREEEKRRLEEKEQREREQKEREAREAEQWERDRREQERKTKEEQQKLDNDPQLAEERRKKDELLRRLQEMDKNRDGSQASHDHFAPSDSTRGTRGNSDPVTPSPVKRTNKDPFLLSRGNSSDSTPSSKKDYIFSRPIENMHQGKPAHEDVTVPYLDRQRKMKAAKEDADLGSYQPSFTSPGSPQKKSSSLLNSADIKGTSKPPKSEAEKKSKLMAELFGSQASSGSPANKKDESEEFFTTSKSSMQQHQTKKKPEFTWNESPTTHKANGSAQRESSILFGGGTALVNEDLGRNEGVKSNLLPRRSRQPATTLSSKPAMVAVNNFDDDIEEVIL